MHFNANYKVSNDSMSEQDNSQSKPMVNLTFGHLELEVPTKKAKFLMQAPHLHNT